MNYGLYLSASGVLTNMYRQDVFANNLANVNTVGYKRDLATIRQRDPESAEDDFGMALRQATLDRIGGGALAGPQFTLFTQGPLQATGGDLDLALQQPDAFFAVAAPRTGGDSPIRLTRDGRFSLDAQGYLVQASSGHRVLDAQDQPIRLPPGGPVRVDDRGNLSRDGQVLARLQITAVRDTQSLQKQGENLFAWTGADDIRRPTAATVRQGFVERSSVDPISALMSLTDAGRAAQSNAGLIRYHDQLMDRAVNTLGRIA